MNFLPENYESPKSSSYYMKLQEGENRIRILTAPIIGWEDWNEKKPFRWTERPAKSFDPKKPVKHFWSFVVWNCIEEQIQVLHVTQATVRNSIEALCKDADWGSPYTYDIKIHKSGEGVDTKYAVNPVPHKTLDPRIAAAFKERPCNLNAIFSNEDPFAPHWDYYAPLAVETISNDMFDKAPVKKTVKKEISEIKNMLKECDPEYQNQLLVSLKKMSPSIDGLENIPVSLYEKIRLAVLKKRDEYQSTLSYSEELFPVG